VLVYAATAQAISVIRTSTEALAGTVGLPAPATSIVVKDANIGFAALPSATCNGSLGMVAFLDIVTSFAVSTPSICLPGVRRLVLSNGGGILLAFADNSNSVTRIDVGTRAYQTITLPAFDRPVSAVFSADDTTAYILSCGAECGGTAANVQAINATTGAAIGTSVPVWGATVGLLSGTTLYTAGSCTVGSTRADIALPCTAANAGLTNTAGVMNVINVSAAQPAITRANVGISDGYHTQMALGNNNKLFIGSSGCTDNPNSAAPTGCLSVYDTSAGGSPVIDTGRNPENCGDTGACSSPKGDVTGLTTLSGRSVFYVVSGGRLRSYSTTTSLETGQFNVAGTVVDVRAIDK